MKFSWRELLEVSVLPQEAHLEIKLYQWKSKLGDRRARESN
jgi:hypothetical protein